jgi:hypothetical protein
MREMSFLVSLFKHTEPLLIDRSVKDNQIKHPESVFLKNSTFGLSCAGLPVSY